MPPKLRKIQLFSGGAETVEASFRLAKSYTKKYEFIGFWNCFHGKTLGTLSICGTRSKYKYGPQAPGYYLVPYAYCYRCPLGLLYPDCALSCIDLVKKSIMQQTTGDLAAILIEPMQGTAGNSYRHWNL